jgi:NACHT domain-containing protein
MSTAQINANKQIAIRLDDTQKEARILLSVMDQYSHFQSDIIGAVRESHRSGSAADSLASRFDRGEVQLASSDLKSFGEGTLQSLAYQEIDIRYDKIPTAYAKTFGWIFNKSSPGPGDCANFVEWLETDERLFWITGKPGSGKSTLMKYILSNERKLKSSLYRWSGQKPLLFLSFYFWNSGSKIQMSLEGLVRTLLHQGLSSANDLAPMLFPSRLELAMIFPGRTAWNESYTWQELLKAFEVFLREVSKTSAVFFFIDGLDEFERSPKEIIQFIEKLFCPNVKVCVSSRPWINFEDAFGQGPSLKVEDLTRGDIEFYVEQKFLSNPGYAALQVLDPDCANQLIQNVAIKASGVFLWVYLVVESLLDGLSGGGGGGKAK